MRYSDRQQQIRDAHRDAVYEAWRQGLNIDRVDYERIRDDVYSGCTSYEAAANEAARLAAEERRVAEARQVMEEECEPPEDPLADAESAA